MAKFFFKVCMQKKKKVREDLKTGIVNRGKAA